MTNRILKKVASPMALLVGALALNACSEDVSGPLPSAVDFPDMPAFTVVSYTPPDGPGGNCPTSSTAAGWTDHKYGPASGAFGSITWQPGGNEKAIGWNINAGWQVWLCVKIGVGSGDPIHGYHITGTDVGTRTYSNGVSHYSYKVEAPPTRPYLPLAATKTAVAAWDSTYAWSLTKKVNGDSVVHFVGSPGQSFNANWLVTATRTQALEHNHRITGTITITNPNPTAVNVTVADVLTGANVGAGVEIRCPAGTGAWAASSVSATVPAGVVDGASGTRVCEYRATGLTGRTTTLNTANVTVVSYDPVANYTGAIGNAPPATAAVTWGAANISGVSNPLLADARAIFGPYSQNITNTTILNPVEPFTCPAIGGPHDYALGAYTSSQPNTATLTGTGLNLSAFARVSLACHANWQGESATGRGSAWPGQNTWFEWNAFSSSVPLVYGRNLTPIGTITMVDNGATVTMNITLNAGARLKAGSGTVKVHPMESAPTQRSHYVQPGAYMYKGSSLTGIVVSKKDFYAIHLDIEIMR
jgi:hypothetical protein